MLIAKEINLTFGQQVVFDNLSFNINKDQKIGLVGRNGSGKTTLLKLFAGLQNIDSGVIELQKDCRIAYMPQDVVLLSEKTIYQEAFSAFEQVEKLKKEAEELEEILHHNDSEDHGEKVERYAHLQNMLLDLDSANAQIETKKILIGLGFAEETFCNSVSTLSVGWKMRLVLAKLLLQKADFYLFDEPTNHLDLVAKDWFLDFLKNSKSGFMLVCHDRYFLDHLIDHVFDINNGQIKIYRGNYSSSVEQKEHDQQVLEKKYVEQQKYIKKQKETIERFRASATKAKMAQSMLKALEKIDLIKFEKKQKTIRLRFADVERSGKTVLNVKDLSKSFGDKTVFQNVSFELERGQKVAIVAPNGMGKTTLINVISGKLEKDSGTSTFGHNVECAIFEQDQNRSLNLNKTILDEVEDSCTTTEQRKRVRGFLGTFLFSGDDVEKKIRVLSGGEKNRVAMVKVLMQNTNFLILDEPTNHLDIQSKEILLQALNQFNGTILFVSHDRDFLNKLSTNILDLTPKGIFSYSGNYDSYLYQKEQQKAGVSGSEQKVKGSGTKKEVLQDNKLNKKDIYKQRKKINNLETKINRFEKEKEKLTVKLVTVEYGSDEYYEISDKIKEFEDGIAKSYKQWEELAK